MSDANTSGVAADAAAYAHVQLAHSQGLQLQPAPWQLAQAQLAPVPVVHAQAAHWQVPQPQADCWAAVPEEAADWVQEEEEVMSGLQGEGVGEDLILVAGSRFDLNAEAGLAAVSFNDARGVQATRRARWNGGTLSPAGREA